MDIELKDLAGLEKPATKLIEVVSAAIGTLYRPRAIRNDADAKAYEVRALAEAEAEAGVIASQAQAMAQMEYIKALAEGDQHLFDRARARLIAREIEGQQNVENIVENALKFLPGAVSDEPVSQNWRREFFLEAENVCDHDMQLLWGKVLAGEVSSPGGFSLRTLDALRHISKHEAELFRRACSLAMADGWIAIPGHDLNTVLQPFGFNYNDILTLRDAGLLMDGDQIHKDFSARQPVPDPEKYQIVLVNNGLLIQLSGVGTLHLHLSVLLFTQVGRELQRLIEPTPCEEYLQALGAHLRGRSVVAKRGISVPQGEGVSVITFEEDL